MIVIMSNLLTMEFIKALNPLYAFPIVAVILCAFIVYAFGFKSPVQPPSFDGIEEEKKSNRKRKTKDTSKTKIIQNGKLNGSISNKAQVSASKKKDTEKSVPVEKPVAEKKVNKKAKQFNEKKNVQEKKNENFTHMNEDAGEDGWVQLISKKGRKSRKKDESVTTEYQTTSKPKASKNFKIDKSGENELSEEFPSKPNVVEELVPVVSEKKFTMQDGKENEVENDKDKVDIVEDSAHFGSTLEKVPLKDVLKNEKVNEETSNKSKRKKKKNTEVMKTDNYLVNLSASPAVQVIPEIPPSQTVFNTTSDTSETYEVGSGKMQEHELKESKSSNVAFDELADLYPKEKEQKKKKKVRRDH